MNALPYVFDVTATDFAARVLEKSHALPVLVDFWAAWCGPCRMLSPVLTQLMQAYGGKVLLAKVDTDQEQQLAQRYGVRSLPTVKIFRHGEVVDEFIGVQPQAVIKRVIDRHLPRAADGLIEQALERARLGAPAEAIELLRNAIDTDPTNDQAKLELVGLCLQKSRLQEAEQLLGTLSVEARMMPSARSLAGRVEFARIAAGAPAAGVLEKAIARNPDDCEARMQLSARQVLDQNYESALQQLLEIVRRNRAFGDDAGRKRMLVVFDVLGGSAALVSKYRNLLSAALN